MTTVSEISRHRELFANLTLRELRGKYKRSVLGWGWSLLNPLAQMAVYSLVFGFFLKVDPPVGDPSGMHIFAFFLLCGLLPWTYFSNGMNAAMGSLIGNANLIKKVYFPREVFVVSAIGSLLVSFLIELGVLGVILLLMGNMVLPWIPVVLVIVVIQSFFVLGIGFLLSVLNVYFRDVQHLVSIALMALFYSAPIVYPISVVPKTAEIGDWTIPLLEIYKLNPLVVFVQCYRDAMYDLTFPAWTSVGYLILWSAAFMLLGLMVFQKLDRRLAEEV